MTSILIDKFFAAHNQDQETLAIGSDLCITDAMLHHAPTHLSIKLNDC